MRRLAAIASLLATSALADSAALVIGNAEYSGLRDLSDAADAADIADDLEDAGFAVTRAQDADGPGLANAAARFAQSLERVRGDEAVVVILAGHFAHAGDTTVLLSARAGGVNAQAIPWGLSLGMLRDLLAAADGDGPRVMVLGSGSNSGGSDMARSGLGTFEGDGVSVISGDIDDALEAAEVLAEPGESFTRRNARRIGVDYDGPSRLQLVEERRVARAPVIERPAAPSAPAPAPAPAPAQGSASQAEREYWATVERFDTRTGYEAYLNRYPNGAYAPTARARLSAVSDDPLRAPRQAEDALALDREQRRGIQADLVTLGFDTRGVDGIFGAGTRAAVRSWQSREGLTETGYLDAGQIATLDRQAARRQAELDIEAERRRAQIQAEDRSYWNETGRGRDEAGLRAYLERYPDGLFAEQAEANLAAIAEENRVATAAQDRAAFERAQQVGTADAYRRYLSAFPQGAYVAEANARLQESEVDQQALAGERALGLDGIGRRLVETGLRQAGYDPGAIDGNFDEGTRRAIRRYQRDRGLPVTGYMNQAIVVRMVAESFLQ